MKHLNFIICIIFYLIFMEQTSNAQNDRLNIDWPNFAKYQEDNIKIGLPKPGENRIVFMGNSITEG